LHGHDCTVKVTAVQIMKIVLSHVTIIELTS